MPERLVHYTFVETPIFSKRLGELASPETLEALQAELVENPVVVHFEITHPLFWHRKDS